MPRKTYGNTSAEEQNKGKINREKSLEELEKNPFKRQIARYGSKGKMFGADEAKKAFPKKAEYDKIEIDPPEDLPEEVVTAIVMGAIVRPDRLEDHILTSSSIGGSSVLGFNQCMVLNNYISGDNRVGEFADLIPQARQEAKDAIEEYKKGNKEPAKVMLTNYIDACVLSSRLMPVGNHNVETRLSNDEMQSIMLGAKLLRDNPLKAESTYSDIEQMRLLNLEKQQNAKVRAAKEEWQLLNDTPPAGSEERKQMIEDILFYSYMSAVSDKEAGELGFKPTSFSEEMMRKSGVELQYIDEDGETYDLSVVDGTEAQYLSGNVDYKIATSVVEEIYGKHKTSDMQVIMSGPDGEEQLKKLYHEAIIQSDEYKDLIEAKPDQIYDMLKGISHKSLEEKFPDVALPKAAEEINEKHQKAFEEEMAKAEKNATKAIQEARISFDAEQYGIKNFTKEALENNVRIISDMFDDLDANDSWYKPSSEQFKKVKKELKEMKRFAQELARKDTEPTDEELKKYDEMAKNIEALSDQYLEYKKNPKAGYETDRVNAVTRLKRHMRANRASVENAYTQREEEKDRKLQQEMTEEYRENVQRKSAEEKVNQYLDHINEVQEKYDMEHRSDVFYGDKYTSKDIAGSKSVYSISRTAIQNTSLIAMTMENKYTMEELLDPNQLKEEKAAMFDQIFQKMTNNTPENQKDLANIYYQGMQSTLKLMDDYEQKIDYSSPDLKQDEHFIAYGKMGHCLFDCWQEMSHCQNELMGLVQRDHPEMKNYQDYKEYMTVRMGATLTSNANYLNAQVENIRNHPELLESRTGAVVLHAVQYKIKLEDIRQTNEQKREVPYSERFIDCYSEVEGKDMACTTNHQVLSLANNISKDKDLSERVFPKLIDGSALKKYQKQSENASPVHKVYIEKAQEAVGKIKEMIDNKTPLVGEKREIAKNCVRDILTEKMVGVLEKSGAKIPANAQDVMNKTVENLPVFQKNTDYLGMGFLGEMAFEDKAVNLVKESMADIQKNLQSTAEKQKEAEKVMENEKQAQAGEKKEIKQPEIKNPLIP